MLSVRFNGVRIDQMYSPVHPTICLVECEPLTTFSTMTANQNLTAGAPPRYPDAAILCGFMTLILSLLLVVAGPCSTRGWSRVVAGIVERQCGEYDSIVHYWRYKYIGSLFVCLLLETSLVVLGIACKNLCEITMEREGGKKIMYR